VDEFQSVNFVTVNYAAVYHVESALVIAASNVNQSEALAPSSTLKSASALAALPTTELSIALS